MNLSERTKGLPSLNHSTVATINILLILLIIHIMYMFGFPYVARKIEVTALQKLSYDIADTVGYDSRVLLVTITKDKQVYLNNQQIESPDKLAKILKLELEKRPIIWRVVYVKAAKTLNYSFVTQNIDIAKGAGATNIRIQVDYLDKL